MEYYINFTSRGTGGKRSTTILQFIVYSQQLDLMSYEYLYLDVYEISPQGNSLIKVSSLEIKPGNHFPDT